MKYVDLEKYGKTRCWRELRGERERKEVKKGKFDRDRNGKKGRGEMRWDTMAMGFVLCVFLFGL